MIRNLREDTVWRVVLISGFMTFIIFGIRLSFSVFFAEFVNVEGWSNEAAASVFSVSMLVFALGSTPSGILLDRFGPRLVFAGGVLLLALGLFLSSRVNTVEQLIITYGLIGGSGLAVVGLGQIAANIAAWVPPSARGRAIGVAFAGTGLGALVFVPLCTWLIEVMGWRNAYIVLGLICVLLLAPLLILFLRKSPVVPSKRGLVGNGRELAVNPIFWLLMLVSVMAIGPLRSLTVHQIAYIQSVGIPRAEAANYVGLAGFLTIGTFIMWGWVSDRFGRALTFTLGAVALASSVLLLLALPDIDNSQVLIVYALLYSLGEGTRSSQTTSLASDVFQSSGLGLVNGLVGAMFGFGAAFGPWIVGRLRDTTGAYTPGFFVVLVMIGISVAGFWAIAWLGRVRRSRESPR